MCRGVCATQSTGNWPRRSWPWRWTMKCLVRINKFGILLAVNTQRNCEPGRCGGPKGTTACHLHVVKRSSLRLEIVMCTSSNCRVSTRSDKLYIAHKLRERSSSSSSHSPLNPQQAKQRKLLGIISNLSPGLETSALRFQDVLLHSGCAGHRGLCAALHRLHLWSQDQSLWVSACQGHGPINDSLGI